MRCVAYLALTTVNSHLRNWEDRACGQLHVISKWKINEYFHLLCVECDRHFRSDETQSDKRVGRVLKQSQLFNMVLIS